MTTIDDLHRRRKEIIEMASVIEGLMTPQQLAIHPHCQGDPHPLVRSLRDDVGSPRR